MDLKIGIRDKRQPGWYQIDNEVYDLGLSCEGLAIYNAIARYANNDTEKAYFSGKKWKRHHKVGHGKLVSGMRELIAHRLIAPTGSKTPVGAAYFELCNIDHLKVKSKAKPYPASEQGGVPPQNRGYSTSEQGGVPPQNTNNTNKTRLINKTDKQDNPLTISHRGIPKKVIEALESYRSHIIDFGQIGKVLIPVSESLALVGEDILCRALEQVVKEAQTPGQDPRYIPRNIVKLLRDEQNLRRRASMYKSPEPVWYESKTEDEIIDTLVQFIGLKMEVPEPLRHLLPKANEIYQKRTSTLHDKILAGVA